MNETEEWAIRMREIVNDAYGEGWEDTISAWQWESRYNDVAKLSNKLYRWLDENTEHWPTLMPLLIEWLKELIE
jgi:hypothetical protein